MEFKKPSFGNGQVELRFESGEICIYATEKGLQRIVMLCKELIEKPEKGHLHLEDYDVLTKESLKGTIAVFISDSK